jgi:hypothetical protein
VRVAAAHERALVLEDLHVADEVEGAETRRLVGPGVDHGPDAGDVHIGERQVVARREAEDAADAARGTGAEQLVVERGTGRRLGEQGREVVVERERRGVRRIRGPVRATIAGAEVARRVIRRALVARRRLDLSLPRALQPMGRAEDPLVEERVVAAMGTGGNGHEDLGES